MVAAKKFIKNTSANKLTNKLDGGVMDAAIQHPIRPACIGKIHERRRPKREEKRLSTNGAHSAFNIQGKAKALAKPIDSRLIPSARKYTGNAVL